MVGRKIGVQSANQALWAAFLKANKLPAARINTVVVGFDPAPLAQRQVDGWLSFITNEPISLGLAGFHTHTFLLADYNHAEIGNVFIATTDALKNNRAAVRACLTAEVATWRACIAKPNQAALATVKDFPPAQSLAAAQQQSLAQNQLMAAGDALTHGLFFVSGAAQSQNVNTLALGGITVTTSQLFDMTVLDEVYAGRPELKAVPARGTI
jgi:ABC-type nitrate/sulfonate/bicarbonate transport system substrate-binding protein